MALSQDGRTRTGFKKAVIAGVGGAERKELGSQKGML